MRKWSMGERAGGMFGGTARMVFRVRTRLGKGKIVGSGCREVGMMGRYGVRDENDVKEVEASWNGSYLLSEETAILLRR